MTELLLANQKTIGAVDEITKEVSVDTTNVVPVSFGGAGGGVKSFLPIIKRIRGTATPGEVITRTNQLCFFV